MRKTRFVALGVAGLWTLLLASVPLRADLAEVEKQIDAERVSLALKNASTKDLFKIYHDLLGVDVQYLCAEDRTVNAFEFESLTVRTSLTAICESTGLKWALEEGTPPVLKITCEGPAPKQCWKEKSAADAQKKENTVKVVKKVAKEEGAKDNEGVSVSISLKDADLSNAMKMAAKLMDAKLLMDVSLSGKTVTLQLEEVPLREFLDAACQQAGATWSVKEGNEKVLEVNKAK